MRTRTRHSGESGQGTLEYVGIMLVVVCLITAVTSSDLHLAPAFQGAFQRAYCLVTAGGPCPVRSAGGTGQGQGNGSGDRSGDGRGDGRGDGSDHGYDHGGLGDGLSSFGSGLKSLGSDVLGALGSAAADIGGFIAGGAGETWGIVKGLVGGLADDLQALGQAIVHPGQTLSDIWDALADGWNGLSGGFMARWNEGDHLGAFGFAAEEIGGFLLGTVVDDGVRQRWADGQYGEAIGRALWNGGSWFLPVAGWVPKIGRGAELAAKGAEAAAKANAAAKRAEIDRKIDENLKSTDRSKRLEGQVSDLIRDKLVEVPNRIVYRPDGTPAGEIDSETEHTLVEVTVSSGGKVPQIGRLRSPEVNPHGKAVILYAPDYNRAATTAAEKAGAKVAKTPADLYRLLAAEGDG